MSLPREFVSPSERSSESHTRGFTLGDSLSVTLGVSHSPTVSPSERSSESHSGIHTRPQSALVSDPRRVTLRDSHSESGSDSHSAAVSPRERSSESHSESHTRGFTLESHTQSHTQSHLGIHTRPCSLCPFQDSWPVAAPQGVRGQALGLLLQIRERKEDGSALLTAGMGLRPTQVPHAHRSAGTCTVGFRGPRGFSAQ